MSLPTRIAAYEDCFRLFDRAIINGARAQFETYGEAHIYKLRLNQARALRAAENRRIYPNDHPAWGKTDYDHLIVRQPVEDPDGKYWVYVEKADANILAIEELDPRPVELPE